MSAREELYDSPAVVTARALMRSRIELARLALERNDHDEFTRNMELAEDALLELGGALQEEADKRRRNGGN